MTVAPARTSGTRGGALTARQRAWADAARAANHGAADRARDEAAKPRRERRPVRRMARSAADAAKADITDWLANSMADPSGAADVLARLVPTGCDTRDRWQPDTDEPG